MSNHVVILAGGKGTRLKPFTASFPKPLVPLGDKPILEVILRQLANEGFREVTLALGHLSQLIMAYVEQSSWINERLNIRFNVEERPTGTAGSLAAIPDLGDTFLVMNGDVLTNLSFRSLLESHRRHDAALTIAAYSKHIKIDLGVLEADDEGFLKDYIEKPEKYYEVSMGVYAFDKRALNFIKRNSYLDFPDLVKRLLAARDRVHVYRNNAYWLDIGRPDDYAQAQNVVEKTPELFAQH